MTIFKFQLYTIKLVKQDKTIQLNYIFTQDTVITDLAPQVAKANRGGPGERKINEIW